MAAHRREAGDGVWRDAEGGVPDCLLRTRARRSGSAPRPGGSEPRRARTLKAGAGGVQNRAPRTAQDAAGRGGARPGPPRVRRERGRGARTIGVLHAQPRARRSNCARSDGWGSWAGS